MSEKMPDQEHLELPEAETIEAYCVTCKQKVEMQNPVAVWTSQGRPGTRGECPICGGTIFRMGKSHLHGNSPKPEPIQVVPITVSNKTRNVRAAYIAADATQANFAQKLGDDLQKLGVYTWVDDGEQVDSTQWAGGVHPALAQCTHLVVVLSSFAEKTASIQDAWNYFLSQRKPVVLVQVEEAVEPPDALRRRPRFNFTGDYKTAFRSLVEALSS